MLIAGIGGQGVVFVTNLIAEAAMISEVPVATSEIHGLSQRRGSVMAAVTFGENSFGFLEKGGADFLLGLESLEAQRCIDYLNRDSRVVIDSLEIYPHSVTSGKTNYPEIKLFIKYLEENISQVIYNLDFSSDLSPILRNVYLLGIASNLKDFPLKPESIEKAITKTARKKYLEESLRAFRMGRG